MSFGAGGDYFITGPGVSSRAFRSHHYGHIRWTNWTQSQATGNGILWINNCQPACSVGTYLPHTVHIAASSVSQGRFTHLLLVYRLNGRLRHDRRVLMRLGSSYDWS